MHLVSLCHSTHTYTLHKTRCLLLYRFFFQLCHGAARDSKVSVTSGPLESGLHGWTRGAVPWPRAQRTGQAQGGSAESRSLGKSTAAGQVQVQTKTSAHGLGSGSKWSMARQEHGCNQCRWGRVLEPQLKINVQAKHLDAYLLCQAHL